MGNFSRNTFDRLKRYVGVRMQQGVPIVDADWNELEDIRKFELQAFLKWFVGNGVPDGNDGFAITANPADNDFNIAAGTCLVEGLDAVNFADLAYTAQLLFNDATLVAAWGVDPLGPLTTPSGSDRTDLVYLDLWDREVNAIEDPDLVNTAIGIETAVRIKREWVVRVAEGAASLPTPPAGHEFYELATLNRTDGDDSVDDIEDLRRTGLTMIPVQYIEQIINDAFGAGYQLNRDGEGNLKVNLRDAINALLRGDIPSSPEADLTTLDPDISNISNRSSIDQNGNLWHIIIRFEQSTFQYNIYYLIYDPITTTWTQAEPISTSGVIFFLDFGHQAFHTTDGKTWVFWGDLSQSNKSITYNRYDPATGTWSGETALTTSSAEEWFPVPIEDNNGILWVFWTSNRNGDYHIYYNQFNPATGSWGTDARLTTGDVQIQFGSSFSALVDSTGDLWVFYVSDRDGNDNIYYNQYQAGSATWTTDTALTFDSETDNNVHALEDEHGNIWVFWVSNRLGVSELFYRKYDTASSTWGSDIQLTDEGGGITFPYILTGNEGDIWVFWTNQVSGSAKIFYKRKNRDGAWSSTIQLTYEEDDDWPSAILDDEGDIWIFWSRNSNNDYKVVYKKLTPSI